MARARISRENARLAWLGRVFLEKKARLGWLGRVVLEKNASQGCLGRAFLEKKARLGWLRRVFLDKKARLFPRNKAFSRLLKATVWHSLSVDPPFSREINALFLNKNLGGRVFLKKKLGMHGWTPCAI